MADNSIFSQDPYEIQQEQLNRKRRMAEAMIAASQQPLGAYPGAPVSIWEGIGKLAEGLLGKYQAKKADQGMQDLATKRQGAITSDYQQLADLIANGTPTQVPTASGPYVPGMSEGSLQQPLPGMIGATQQDAQPLPMRSAPQVNPIYNGNGMDRGPQREATPGDIIGLASKLQTPQMKEQALQYALAQKDKQFGRDIEQAKLADEQKRTEMMGKNYESEDAARKAAAKYQSDKVSAALAASGQKFDEKGNIVSQDPSEFSPGFRSKLDAQEAMNKWRDAQDELAHARAEFEKTKSDPNSPASLKAAETLRQAQVRLSIQEQNMLRGNNTYNARYRGIGPDGQPLAGIPMVDGMPVGTSVAANVRPTSQQRNKADMANSALHQIDTMTQILNQRPDIFGPVAGRKQDFDTWIGSQDPEASMFNMARTILAEHAAGAFGGVSEGTIKKLEEAIGRNKTNPGALKAALEQAKSSMQMFAQQGGFMTGKPNRGGQQTRPPKVIRFDAAGNIIP